MKGARGSVLLLSLWATATLASIGIAQATHISLELKWVDRLHEARQAWYLVLEGIAIVSSRLSTPDPATDNPAWDALKESWGQTPKKPLSFELGTVQYRVQDEQARIPLNAAAATLLARLPGFTQPAADELVRRRAEKKLVSHLGELPSVLKNFGFQSESLTKLEPLVTLYGVGPVNLNTASDKVLVALGLTEGFAKELLGYPAGLDGVVGTSDDGILEEVTSEKMEAVLKGFYGPEYVMTQEEKDTVNALGGLQPPLVGVSSSLFRADVESATSRHGIKKKVSAVLQRSERILVEGWTES